MKKIISTILVAFTFLLVSCESDTTADVSRVTNYPVFTFDETVTVPLGGVYNPNVVVTEGDQEIAYTVAGDDDVDVNQVGVYTVTYSATNVDGFTANAVQTVIVHDPTIVGTNVSGNIRDAGNNARTGVISLVPGTTSIFLASDFGFAGAFPVYFQMNGDVISDIHQPYINGVSNVDLTYNPITNRFTILIHPQGFGYTFEYY